MKALPLVRYLKFEFKASVIAVYKNLALGLMIILLSIFKVKGIIKFN